VKQAEMLLKKKRKMKYKIRIAALLICSLAWTYSNAQVQDENTPGYDFSSPDTTYEDSGYAEEGGAPAEGGDKVDPLLRPYERIVLYIDSTTNLITYNGVIEQEDSGSDSLYLRAKKWAQLTFGKEVKVEVDKRNQKLVYIGSIPAYAYMSKYTKRDIGRFEFKITFLIKEGRYKYQITNLVHESVKPSAGGKGNRNYFEYYYTSTTRIRENDIILRNADKDIQKMIEGIIIALREPVIVDEDDW
jgi:hypothetical protein